MIPSARITIMIEITPTMSVWSWSEESRTPRDGELGTMTSSSPANRPCHANAQPCFSPAT